MNNLEEPENKYKFMIHPFCSALITECYTCSEAF